MAADQLSSSDLPKKILGYGATPLSRLLGLTNLFKDISNDKNVAGGPARAQLKKLSLHDINLLKEIIHSEVEKTPVKNPEVISDQILFLFIGAIQIHQNDSKDTWPLVYQSIQDFLKPPPRPKIAVLGFIAATLIVSVTIGGLLYASKTELPSGSTLKTAPAATSISVVGPATLGVLVSIYNQMKGGVCQLPQAGMLPPEQMHAYLTFIRDGVVVVNDVDNLKLALRYVTCSYPQKLMYAPL